MPTIRSRLETAAIVVLLLATVRAAARAQAPLTPPDTVVIQSGALHLRALLWRPSGAGPFPAVVFNHGQAPRPLSAAQVDAVAKSALGPAFQKHGYILLSPFRRGEGLSRDEGVAIQDVIATHAKTAADSSALLDSLLRTEQLDDVRAAIAYLRARPDVVTSRVSVAGHSQGGVLAILAGAADSSLHSVLDFAGAERSWRTSPTMRAMLLDAVGRLRVPLLMVHAANGNPEPGRAMEAALQRRHRPSQLIVYPPFGKSFDEAHRFVLLDVPEWEADVFRFLDEGSATRRR